MSLQACVDEPTPGAVSYRHSVTVRGFAFSRDPAETITRVSVSINGHVIGFTTSFFDRPDVGTVFGTDGLHSGFEILCEPDLQPPDDAAEIDVIAHISTGTEAQIGRIPLHFASTNYLELDYGGIIDRARVERWTRDRIYGSGPPSPTASLECVALIKRYLHPGQHVLDIGCGIGAYAEPLIQHGIDWTGCEQVQSFCDRVVARGLTCVRVEGSSLPFACNSFEQSICIEVLEHIAQPETFIAEISRVTRKSAYFSVPNAELIPVMRPLNAVPWHLLEGDHKSFFSRQSLAHLLSAAFEHVEVIEYAPLPIKSIEGLPLPCHLFAIASHA